MAVNVKSLGVDYLGVDERLALIEALWDSISADESAIPLTDAQRTELDCRLADHEANLNDVISWDEVRASLNQRLKR
jgi:putative addiction module component (TIGR02574 family)